MPFAIDTRDGSQPVHYTEWSREDSEMWGLDNADFIPRPPISPITPTRSFERLPGDEPVDGRISHAPATEPRLIEGPAPVPIDEETNPDVLALRAAASVLQLQKHKAKRDIQTLKEIRDAAVDEPERFVEELRSQKLQREPDHSDPLKATFEDDSDEQDEEDVEMTTDEGGPPSKFKQIPSSQVIVRCPPINWEKYHIVGEALDSMHEQQRRRPTPGQPWSEERDAIVAAPYSPFRDRPQQPPPAPSQPTKPHSQLPPPMQTRKSFRRKSQG